jgi:hypothetical protein
MKCFFGPTSENEWSVPFCLAMEKVALVILLSASLFFFPACRGKMCSYKVWNVGRGDFDRKYRECDSKYKKVIIVFYEVNMFCLLSARTTTIRSTTKTKLTTFNTGTTTTTTTTATTTTPSTTTTTVEEQLVDYSDEEDGSSDNETDKEQKVGKENNLFYTENYLKHAYYLL